MRGASSRAGTTTTTRDPIHMVCPLLRMRRWPLLLLAVAIGFLIWAGTRATNHRPFPPDTTPEGAYMRIALCVAERRPQAMFPYLETEAQWAAYTIRDMRRKACDRVRASYPSGERDRWLAAWHAEADAPDGADLFALLAVRHGWIARLDRDLSGVTHVDIQGPRATVVTARGTHYPFRLRDGGLWGLTIFTAELQAEAERASRDLEVVERDAADYDRVNQR
jgi:hypothetical protein